MTGTARRSLAVVTAGLGQPSASRLLADRLAAATVEALATHGLEADVHTIEVREYAHDAVNQLLTGFPSAVLRKAVDTIAAADGLIAVAPTFKASYSGLFKVFFDGLDDAVLAGKPVLLGATGGSARHSLVLEHALRPMFGYLRTITVPTAVFAATDDWGAQEAETALRARIERGAAELAAEVARREPVPPPDPFALTASFDQLLAGE